MKSVFKEATRWALTPMLDCIVRKFSDWFTQRKDVVCRLIDTRLVHVVENYLHDLWDVAQQLSVRELNSYELKYEITDTAGRCFGRAWLENLVLARCGSMKSFLVCTVGSLHLFHYER